MSDEPQTENSMVAALLREREGLVQRGLTDRVKQVDEQLKFHGYKRPTGAKKDAAAPPQPPAAPPTAPPKGRQQPPAATT